MVASTGTTATITNRTRFGQQSQQPQQQPSHPIPNNNTHVKLSCLPHTATNSLATLCLKKLQISSVLQHHIDEEKKDGFYLSERNDEEYQVEAKLYALGGLLPLHATPVLSRSATSENETVVAGRAVFAWEKKEVLTFPVRWKDLCRDSTLEISVLASGGGNSKRVKWNTSLKLFGEYGVLENGLLRLKLFPARTSENLNGEDEEEDEEWEATRILYSLDLMQEHVAAKGKEVTDTAGQGTHPMPLTEGTTGTNGIVSVPWLDALTRERCDEIVEQARNFEGPGGCQDQISTADCQSRDMRQYSSLGRKGPSYLVVELPTSDIPIIHEETFYPNTLHGASGSVTALDLSLHKHHEQQVRMAQQRLESKTSKIPSPVAEFGAISNSAVPQEMGLSLLQLLLDQEETECDATNPTEQKYRTLAHDLLRGLVDPALKPNKLQKARLATIINSPSQHLSQEEKDLLWRFRFSLVDNRRALTKFLLAVEWGVESEVVQTAELLERWRERSPIEVTDALKLLGRNNKEYSGSNTPRGSDGGAASASVVAAEEANSGLVRGYAIDTLESAPDGELRLYLLQLVQALKYEDVALVTRRVKGGGTAGLGKKGKRSSSLVLFLIDRAAKNIELANYLYWYLKVELEDPTHGDRYRSVFEAFQDTLSSAPYENDCNNDNRSKQLNFTSVLGSVSKLGSSLQSTDTSAMIVGKRNFRKTTSSGKRTISMWDVLSAQDQFITGIMNCQLKSRDTRGKKDAKELSLRSSLASGGFQRLKDVEAVPLPSAPHILINGVNPVSARMFKSALYPAVIEFSVAKNNRSITDAVSKEVDTGLSTSSTYKVIVKTGDDLRQDQLVIMMIQLMDRLLKRGTLDLCLKPYSIIAVSQTSGVVEFVDGSIPISQILGRYNNSIMQFFQSVALQDGAKYAVQPEVMQTYIRSCAGYCVITYLIGVGDRHLDNIMLLPSGHFFHIDFGFIFGRDPKPLPPAFRLTREMVDGMGGMNSTEYRQFCSLACQAFNLLRKSAGLVLNLLHLMSDAGIQDLSNNPSADAEGVISKVEERFRLELTDEQAEVYFLGLINECLAALAPRVMDVFHQIAVARR